MVVRFPDSTKDITLEQMQSIEGDKPKAFFENILKVDPQEFTEETMLAWYATFEHMIHMDKIALPEMGTKVVDGYYLPPHVLDIRVKHFIEIVNADIDKDNFRGLEVYAGCFYRKDWDKDYSDKEVMETANAFLKKPLYYSLVTSFLMADLVATLKATFPILYSRDPQEGEEKEEGRKLYDMLNGLAKDDVTKWEQVESLKLGKAFAWLELKKKEMIEERLRTAQRKS